MMHDDPDITAYVLGELSGADASRLAQLLETDPAAAELADQTRLIAGILGGHFVRPARRRLMPSALAASLLMIASTFSLLCRSANAPHAPIASIQSSSSTSLVLHLSGPSEQSSLFADTPAMDVEQFVASVLADASRLNSFSSLRLTSDLPDSFQ